MVKVPHDVYKIIYRYIFDYVVKSIEHSVQMNVNSYHDRKLYRYKDKWYINPLYYGQPNLMLWSEQQLDHSSYVSYLSIVNGVTYILLPVGSYDSHMPTTLARIKLSDKLPCWQTANIYMTHFKYFDRAL